MKNQKSHPLIESFQKCFLSIYHVSATDPGIADKQSQPVMMHCTFVLWGWTWVAPEVWVHLSQVQTSKEASEKQCVSWAVNTTWNCVKVIGKRPGANLDENRIQALTTVSAKQGLKCFTSVANGRERGHREAKQSCLLSSSGIPSGTSSTCYQFLLFVWGVLMLFWRYSSFKIRAVCFLGKYSPLESCPQPFVL
jgi:hypothetical protein